MRHPHTLALMARDRQQEIARQADQLRLARRAELTRPTGGAHHAGRLPVLHALYVHLCARTWAAAQGIASRGRGLTGGV